MRRLFCAGLSMSINTVSGPALLFLNIIAAHLSAITIRKLWKDTCLLLTKPGNYTVHLEPHGTVIVGAVSHLAGVGSVDIHQWCQQGQTEFQLQLQGQQNEQWLDRLGLDTPICWLQYCHFLGQLTEQLGRRAPNKIIFLGSYKCNHRLILTWFVICYLTESTHVRRRKLQMIFKFII